MQTYWLQTAWRKGPSALLWVYLSCLFICSIYPCICPSLRLSIYLSGLSFLTIFLVNLSRQLVHLSSQQSIYASICLSIYLSIYLAIQSTCASIVSYLAFPYLSFLILSFPCPNYLSLYLSKYLIFSCLILHFTFLSYHSLSPPICLSVCPSDCLFSF